MNDGQISSLIDRYRRTRLNSGRLVFGDACGISRSGVSGGLFAVNVSISEDVEVLAEAGRARSEEVGEGDNTETPLRDPIADS